MSIAIRKPSHESGYYQYLERHESANRVQPTTFDLWWENSLSLISLTTLIAITIWLFLR